MLLGLADYLDSNWSTVWIVAGVAGLGLALLTFAIAYRRKSTRTGVFGVIAAVALVSSIAATWRYFGWETLYTDTGTTVRYHRIAGRVTLVAYDRNGDWWTDAKTLYSWDKPWMKDREVLHEYIVAMEDRNSDGRWDTWWTPVHDIMGDHPYIRLEADLDLDGLPDFGAVEPADLESENYEAEVAAIRGF